MQVKDLMTKVVKVVTGEQSLLEIRELMLNNNLRRIPVVDGDGHLKGIVTDGDVARATPSDASTLDRYEANYILGKLKAKDLMTKAVITVKAEDGVETAAYLMYKFKIGALPVVDTANKSGGDHFRYGCVQGLCGPVGLCQDVHQDHCGYPGPGRGAGRAGRHLQETGRKHHFRPDPEDRTQTGCHYRTG